MSVDVQTVRRDALRAMVYLGVGQGVSARLRWGPRQGLPSILNVAALRGLTTAAGADADQILLNDSQQTLLERAQGRWKSAMSQLTDSDPRNETVASLGRLLSSTFALWSALTNPAPRHWEGGGPCSRGPPLDKASRIYSLCRKRVATLCSGSRTLSRRGASIIG
jgi:hypothetical protein